MNDDRIDFSSLDPARDAKRWERLADTVAAKALARRASVLAMTRSWARPALAAAAALALIVWGATWWRGRGAEPAPQAVVQSQDPTLQMLAWASSGQVPDDALNVLTGQGQR